MRRLASTILDEWGARIVSSGGSNVQQQRMCLTYIHTLAYEMTHVRSGSVSIWGRIDTLTIEVTTVLSTKLVLRGPVYLA